LCSIYQAVHVDLQRRQLPAKLTKIDSIFSLRKTFLVADKVWFPHIAQMPCMQLGETLFYTPASNLIEIHQGFLLFY
jgi:hypothetical protein